MRKVNLMGKESDAEAWEKRQNIQVHFWRIVGAVEHINIPKLEYFVKKEFNTTEDRFVQAQIRLMQTESRIRIQGREKVWVKQPENI